MIQVKKVKNAFLVPLPILEDGSFNFTFTATIGGRKYDLVFKFYDDKWHLWVYFPDESIREAGVFPGDCSWTAYDDFGLYVFTTLDVIGQNSLGSVAFYFLEWV